MALTLSEIQALTDDVWLPNSYDNWSKGNVMMHKLLERVEKIGSAEYVRVILEYARARGGAMSGTTIFDTAKKAIFNAARYPWAFYWSGTTYDIEDEVKSSGGDSDVDIVLGKLDNVQTSIRDYMGDDLWRLRATSVTAHGAETQPFYGIPDMMNSSTGTAYGGITPTDLMYPDGSASLWLSGNVTDALAMSFSTMQALRRECAVSNNNAGKPDLYVTTEALWDAFEACLQPQQRHTDTNLAQAGFDNLKFGSRGTVVADDKCPANYVHAFNTEYLIFRAHKNHLFSGPKWKQPTNQAIMTTQIIFVGVFGTSQRRAHGRLTNVSA